MFLPDFTSSFDDIQCLSNSTCLNELSMDGNPFANDPTYKQTVLRNLSSLRQLDMKRISVRVTVFIACYIDTVDSHVDWNRTSLRDRRTKGR